jgi:dTMP kinase
MKKLFIVFEGIDGSGTSTQANLLVEYFRKNSHKAITTSEPSNGPIGHLIREAMKKRIIFAEDRKKFDDQMAYLFAADRHDHLYNDVDGILKLINDGFHVISTRYYFSSLAYHCDNQEEFEFIKRINERFPKPDLVIYLDNAVDVSMSRISNRSVIDHYENTDELTKVKKNYDHIFAEYNELLLTVKADDSIQSIHESIVKFIEEKIFDV